MKFLALLIAASVTAGYMYSRAADFPKSYNFQQTEFVYSNDVWALGRAQ